MKIAFIAVSVLCGILLSLLAAMLQTGTVPFRHAPALPTTAADQPATAVIRLLGVDQLNSLMEALGKDRAFLAEKILAVTNREGEAQAREQIAASMDAELTRLIEHARSNVVEIATVEQSNLRQLAELYGRMEAESAARALSVMEKEQAAKILSRVNERRAAAILDAVVSSVDKGAELAAEWTDIMRRMKIGAATAPPGGA